MREEPESQVEQILEFLEVEPAKELSREAGETHNETKYPKRHLYYWVRQCWHIVRGPIEGIFPKATDAVRQSVRQVLFSEEKPPMDQAVREYLRDLYAEHNARLAEYLGQDLSHWE